MADLEKIVEELSGLTLLEAAELKTMLEDKWGVTAAVGGPVMMAGVMPGGDAGAAAVEEKEEWNVVITDVGPKKIQVIKAVRALTELGLKDAKDLVESTPSTVMEGVPKEVAEEAKGKLEAEGAVINIE